VHFYDPVHADIFRAVQAKRARGEHISPVTMKGPLGGHEGLSQLGGTEYLARLAGSVISTGTVAEVAADMVEISARRDVISAAERAIFTARALDEDGGADAAVQGLEADLDWIREGFRRQRASASLSETVDSAIREMIAARDKGPATPTGFADLDHLIGGLFAGDMVLIGGRPSMGKTALAQSMAHRIARRGRSVIFASLEMRGEDLAFRMVSEAAREQGRDIHYQSLRRGNVDDDEARAAMEAAITIQPLPVDVVGPHIRRMPDLSGEISRLARRRRSQGAEIGAVIIDYLGLIQPAQDRWQSDNSRIAAISQSLKGLAHSLAVPLVVISQLNRQVENRDDKRPQMSDLRDSGSLEQDADCILFAYREEYYLQRLMPSPDDMRYPEWLADFEQARGRMDVICAKQRMGPTGTATLACDLATNSIWDMPG